MFNVIIVISYCDILVIVKFDLILGESQQSYFPGLARGLVAVLLFYDGRASLVYSLKMLLQAREGRTWSLGLNEDLCSQVTKFTDQIMKEQLANHILGIQADLIGTCHNDSTIYQWFFW